jgi:hypothetical protein
MEKGKRRVNKVVDVRLYIRTKKNKKDKENYIAIIEKRADYNWIKDDEQ